jgi:hypothetical protein
MMRLKDPCAPQAPKNKTRPKQESTVPSHPEGPMLPKKKHFRGPLGLLAALVGNYTGSFYEMVLDSFNSFDSFIRILPPEKKNFV